MANGSIKAVRFRTIGKEKSIEEYLSEITDKGVTLLAEDNNDSYGKLYDASGWHLHYIMHCVLLNGASMFDIAISIASPTPVISVRVFRWWEWKWTDWYTVTTISKATE